MVLDVMIEVAVVVCPEGLLATGVAVLFYAVAEGTGATFDLIYVFEEAEVVETLESVVLAFC